MISEWSRFIMVGVVNVVSTFLLYQLLNLFLAYGLAFTISYAAGIVISLFGNARYVFFTQISRSVLIIYPAYYTSSYMLGLGILYALVECV